MTFLNGITESIRKFVKHNVLLIVFCLFGMFWCALAALMIYEYSTLILPVDRSYVPPALQTRKHPHLVPVVPPCENKFCPFGAQCYVNTTSGDPYCKCITKCDSLFSPVCGSNMVSYSNECHMLRASCHQKKRITVMYNQPCEKHSKDNIGMVSD